MSDRIHELLNRNLQDVFGEGDARRRRTAIEELYTDTGALSIGQVAGDLRATHPEFAYTPLGEPQDFITPGDWRGGPVCEGRGPITQVWT
jgi:hypothetical protein